jgi:3-deoxy-manno-octulosonate cytidylyltransferase (CMP-KDO synthetase)
MKQEHNLHFAGIIPARFASSRFPGKPLVMIGNKTMVQRVYDQASQILESVWVATDDERIFKTVRGFGGNVIMTSPDHLSGTDRCAEASEIINQKTGRQVDIVVNIQGDEPFIKPEQIASLLKCFDDRSVEIATLIRVAEPGEDIFNPNQPKVIVSLKGDALYFSRAAIPYLRDSEMSQWSGKHKYYKHIGLYAYTTETLKRITSLERSSLEIAESLEQNRWLENGFRIRTAVTEWESLGIDTPADLEKANLIFSKI